MHRDSYCRCSAILRFDGVFRLASAAARRFNSSSSCMHTDEPVARPGVALGIDSGLAPRAQGVSEYVVLPAPSVHL